MIIGLVIIEILNSLDTTLLVFFWIMRVEMRMKIVIFPNDNLLVN